MGLQTYIPYDDRIACDGGHSQIFYVSIFIFF